MSQPVRAGTYEPVEPERPRDPRIRAMVTSGALALGLGAAAVLLPAPYVLEAPGPTFNTIGEARSQPLIEISGRETFDPEGELDLTTVYVSGGPNGDVSIFDAFRAWIDPDQTVRPEELVYAPGTTRSDIEERNSVSMISSQESAIAAALGHLEIPYEESLTVVDLAEGSASAGVLEPGDTITSIDGAPVRNIDTLRSALTDAAGAGVDLEVLRAGSAEEVSVTPKQSPEGDYQLGVLLTSEFDFPFDVTIALDNVGGPSAGSMFALGIIDMLTEGDLTGGRHFAGTGTIDSTGAIGKIGGIQQKLVGAHESGAEFFLAPAENCAEVVGHVPDGLKVVKVSTLEEAVNAVEVLGSGGDGAGLPACS
ncbi:YlbL family protein [Arthrobacter zhaoguopingii]|uniref:YlbL family protein n=1 Tax=Arthrobacter zhaoguopingii TaxID=2681491 RepID=UPI001FE2F991|nr:S16 family serine protease [Arthrobacter zhaoguopingii]